MTTTIPTGGRTVEVRRRFAGLAEILLREGQPELARECADLAVRAGLWRHPFGL